jgi:ketosteroid isomerase-like protein
MSQPPAEILRAGFDAFNRGDYDSWLEAFSEDVEVHDLAETPDSRGPSQTAMESK